MKKITFLVLHLGFGGIETSTINTANALSKFFDVEIVSFYNLKNNQSKNCNSKITIKYILNNEPNKEEIKYCIKHKKIIKLIKEIFKSVKILYIKKFKLLNCFKRIETDILISTRIEFSEILNKYKNKKIVKIAQEHQHHNNNLKYIKKIKSLKNIDYLFALTEGLKKDYELFNNNIKVITVPNMLSDEFCKISNLSKPNIISVGRLHHGKRIDELINIFKKANTKNWILTIVGDGEDYQMLKSKIKNIKNIKMVGGKNKNEINELLSESSIFMMTSITEGLPMVLLEAMKCGVPCIAYNTDSGISDIIDNKKNGYVINDRNEKEYIEKLNILINDKEKRLKFSKNCLEKSSKFNSENITKIWIQIINQNK